ncbi:MAG: hypothetical protein IPM54_03455 [Polyangiaceae bacterium]|nr:hypothetical protein [Polyangiaceae bacterium]
MPHPRVIKPAIIAFAAMLSLGCNKSRDSGSSSATVAESAPVENFPSLDPKTWVNGAPLSLADSREKHVLLMEAWHPA